MRFISFDVDPQGKDSINSILYKSQPNKETSVIEDGNTLLLSSEEYVQGQGSMYYYANPIVKKYYQIKTLVNNLQTISTLATWGGVTITTNFSSTFLAYTFYWNISKLMQIKSKMWITIFTDKGIYLVLPKLISTSKQLTDFNVIGSHVNDFNNFNIEGESADYNITIDNTDTVIPDVINSSIKTQIMNVEKSLNDIIYISAGKTVNPMDYVLYNGNTYLIVSQKRDKEQYLYTAVRSYDLTYTFSGSVIRPLFPYDVPRGTVKMHASSSVPRGYLLCDGTGYLATDYPELYAIIGTTWGSTGAGYFSVPDIKGASPAGVGTSVGYTENETIALGTKYDDKMQGHWHVIRRDGTGNYIIGYNLYAGTVNSVAESAGKPASYHIASEFQSDGTNGTPRTGKVTKGKQVGINFIIKY